MLVGHASPTRQYRYCTVKGCRESCQSNRVFRLQNAMCVHYGGEIDAEGKVRLRRGVI